MLAAVCLSFFCARAVQEVVIIQLIPSRYISNFASGWICIDSYMFCLLCRAGGGGRDLATAFRMVGSIGDEHMHNRDFKDHACENYKTVSTPRRQCPRALGRHREKLSALADIGRHHLIDDQQFNTNIAKHVYILSIANN